MSNIDKYTEEFGKLYEQASQNHSIDFSIKRSLAQLGEMYPEAEYTTLLLAANLWCYKRLARPRGRSGVIVH